MPWIQLWLCTSLWLPRQTPDPGSWDPAADLLAAASEALARGDADVACEAARAALARAPGEPTTLLVLARSLERLGRYEEALASLEQAPCSPSFACERGRALRGAGRAQEAEAALRLALASYPSCGPAMLELAELLLESDRLKEAWELTEPLLARAPEREAVVALAATCLVALEREAEACALLEARVELQQNSAGMRLRLAALHASAGRARTAWEVCEPLLATERHADVLVAIARHALRAERPLAALAALGSALASDSSHASSLAELGELLEQASSLRAQLARRRIEARPGDVASWCEALEVELDESGPEAFFHAWTAMPQEVRADVSLRTLEGEALRRAGRIEEARARLTALCSEGENARACYELGLLEYAAENPAVAEAAFARGATGPWAADAHFNRGVCLERLGQYEAAAHSYEAALASRREFQEAWYQLGSVRRLRLGDATGARQAYAEYLRLGGDDPEVRRWLERSDR